MQGNYNPPRLPHLHKKERKRHHKQQQNKPLMANSSPQNKNKNCMLESMQMRFSSLEIPLQCFFSWNCYFETHFCEDELSEWDWPASLSQGDFTVVGMLSVCLSYFPPFPRGWILCLPSLGKIKKPALTFHRREFWLWWRSASAGQKHQHGKCQRRSGMSSSLYAGSSRPAVKLTPHMWIKMLWKINIFCCWCVHVCVRER